MKRFYNNIRGWLSLFIFLLIMVSFSFADSPRFKENGKETIVDTKTGLVWQKKDSYHEVKKGMNWYDALEYVDQKNSEKFAGHNDWRLPSMKELQEIWDSQLPNFSKDNEPIGLPKAFSKGGSYYVWTGDEKNLDNAWYFGLGQQEDYFNLKDLADLDQGVIMVRSEK